MSTRQKGRILQEFIAKAFKKITPYVFSRADSGSGKYHKEDITLPDYIPLHIEAKNRAVADIKNWWKQTLMGCPKSKYPTLIYKLNYQHDATVYMRITDFILLLENRVDLLDDLKISINFTDFMKVLENKYNNSKV